MNATCDRRTHLADAGLRIIARLGARGLTHRAVDREANVPAGTTSNYFRTRNALLGALGNRVMERFAPDPARLQELAKREPTIELYIDYVRYIVERTTRDPDLTRALFELRLEAARHPELAGILQETLQRGFRNDVVFNENARLPGGALEIALLHYAIDGLLLDRLTVSIGSDESTDTAIETLVRRILDTPAE